jgi:hypothetical protein
MYLGTYIKVSTTGKSQGLESPWSLPLRGGGELWENGPTAHDLGEMFHIENLTSILKECGNLSIIF